MAQSDSSSSATEDRHGGAVQHVLSGHQTPMGVNNFYGVTSGSGAKHETVTTTSRVSALGHPAETSTVSLPGGGTMQVTKSGHTTVLEGGGVMTSRSAHAEYQSGYQSGVVQGASGVTPGLVHATSGLASVPLVSGASHVVTSQTSPANYAATSQYTTATTGGYTTSGGQYTASGGAGYTAAGGAGYTAAGGAGYTAAGGAGYTAAGGAGYTTTGGYTTSGGQYTTSGGQYAYQAPATTGNLITPRTAQYQAQQSGTLTGYANASGGIGAYTDRAQYSTQQTTTLRGQQSGLLTMKDGQTVRRSSTAPVFDRGTTAVSRTVVGEERVLETRQYVDETRTSVIAERVVEHEVRIPKKIMIEEVIERVVIIPERRIREEIIEEVGVVKEKIVEIAKSIIEEKIVEVPETEYVEKIVEVPEVIVQEKIKEVAKIEIQERVVEVPNIIIQEKIVEIPEIEYRDVPQERVEVVPEIREQIVVKEIPIAQYIDKPFPEYVTVEDIVDTDRMIPVPIEAITTYEFKLPQIRPSWKKVDVPLYVPRFVELPVPVEMMHERSIAEAENYAKQVSMLGFQSALSLCEIENLAKAAKDVDFQSMITTEDMTTTVIRALESGTLQITGTFTTVDSGVSGMVISGQQGVNYTVSTTHQPVSVETRGVKHGSAEYGGYAYQYGGGAVYSSRGEKVKTSKHHTHTTGGTTTRTHKHKKGRSSKKH